MSEEEPRQAGFWATFKAVFWSFAGVRKRNDYQRDAGSLNLKALIVAGIAGGLLFVLAIVAFLKLVVRV
ncbi:MAG: DUF2970 domain-containing protein [Rhodocyclaceae bacterium]|nr:DUF2970 domain-containing protein [Rhodocyclaceae bacterium]MCP5231783.1 DUF2970 domain-containing protein [Zoogloeaceae bacterium]MCB1913843.1 DUF2970 domain-containing protein [Rhodocyclaceae bacterium]MCP5241005.1 DUF2970 domain-containing protein [Zoogloeaceae bacterium]MCP5255630.1 DUF2970 domain-containing protein [Zoogloeaceae bacterium]